MSDRETLERARELIGPSTLDLEQIYRRRTRRQAARRLGAALTAIAIVVTGSGLLLRSLRQDAPVGRPLATDTASFAAPTDVTPDLPSWADLRAVASSNAGYVAVGDTSGGDGTDPVWFSADGAS